MNIKTIRNNYEQLTMLERLSLVDNAISRNDKNEVKAVAAASPRKTFSQVDYYDLLKEISIFRMCNFICRLGYVIDIDFFLICAAEKREELPDGVRLGAFLYVRATDSWRAVSRELGLSPNFDEKLGEFLPAVETLNKRDGLLRRLAFTEEEAAKYLKTRNVKGKIKTLEDEIKAIREALELPKE